MPWHRLKPRSDQHMEEGQDLKHFGPLLALQDSDIKVGKRLQVEFTSFASTPSKFSALMVSRRFKTVDLEPSLGLEKYGI
jgi:hypothetical protein